MAYNKTTWVNNQGPPISAGNLNQIEDGIFEAHQDITNLDSRVAVNESDIATLTNSVTTLESQNIDTRLTEVENITSDAYQWDLVSVDTTLTVNDSVFVDTRSNQVTITLPESPSIGDFVRINDVAGYFGTTACNVIQNGVSGENIMGVADSIVLSTNNQSVELVYSGDATLGWRITVRA